MFGQQVAEPDVITDFSKAQGDQVSMPGFNNGNAGNVSNSTFVTGTNPNSWGAYGIDYNFVGNYVDYIFLIRGTWNSANNSFTNSGNSGNDALLWVYKSGSIIPDNAVILTGVDVSTLTLSDFTLAY